MSACQVDFLPPSWRARRAQRRTIWSRLGAIALVLIAIATSQISLVHQKMALDRELAEIETEHARARGRIAEVEELARKKDELAARLELLKDVLKRARGADVIAAVARSAPEGVGLDTIKFHVGESSGAPEIELNITGTSPSHESSDRFATALRKSTALSRADLGFSQEAAQPGIKVSPSRRRERAHERSQLANRVLSRTRRVGARLRAVWRAPHPENECRQTGAHPRDPQRDREV
jgi:Tfp pilus assembly protein PilN